MASSLAIRTSSDTTTAVTGHDSRSQQVWSRDRLSSGVDTLAETPAGRGGGQLQAGALYNVGRLKPTTAAGAHRVAAGVVTAGYRLGEPSTSTVGEQAIGSWLAHQVGLHGRTVEEAQRAALNEMLDKGIVTAPRGRTSPVPGAPSGPVAFAGPPVSQTLIEDRR
jgi:hypothetical protein